MIPLEFCIDGPPVSLQAKPRSRLKQWKQAVRKAAEQAMPEGVHPFAGPVRLVITYYYEGERLTVDVDNIIKPIQDALAGLVYVNDRQVVNPDCEGRRLDGAFVVVGMSLPLALAFVAGREFIHIKVDHPRNPQELRR